MLNMNKRPTSAQTIARNIRLLMNEHGMSQAALGRKAGVAQTLLSALLSREDGIGIKNPQSSTVDKIADAFGVQPWKLLVPGADLSFLQDGSVETLIDHFTSCGAEGRRSILRTAENEVRYQARQAGDSGVSVA